MRKLVAILMALVVALTACSSDVSVTANEGEPSGSGSDGGSESADSADGGSSDDDSSGDDSSGDDSSDDGSSDDGGFTGGGSDDWCALSQDFSDTFDEAFGLDPDSLMAAYESVLDRRDEALAVAPEEIRDDVEVVFDWIADEFIPALEAADGDITALDESLLESPELEAASDNLDRYDEEVCGLSDDMMDDGMDSGMADDEMMTDGGAAEDLLDDMLEDGEFDDSAILQQTFEIMGLTAEEAACMADGITTTDLEDENVLFEQLEKCGLTIMDLAGG